jgi:uridylate kinase
VLGKENAHRNVLRTKEQVRRALNEKILVCGGNLPGCSTDYDAALFAEALRADLLINATNIDGVYSSDPKKDPKAKKFDRLSYGEFERIISKNPQLPGGYGLFDLKGVEIIRRARIKMVVIDGTDPEEIVRAVEGRHSGTVIE